MSSVAGAQPSFASVHTYPAYGLPQVAVSESAPRIEVLHFAKVSLFLLYVP